MSMPSEPSEPSESSEPPPAPEVGADPFVDGLVERAAARYVDLIDPEALAEMKDELRMFLTAHPRASRVIDRGRAWDAKKRSAEGLAAHMPAAPEAPVVKGKAGGEPR